MCLSKIVLFPVDIFLKDDIIKLYRGVAQMVECLVWDQDAAGSSPVTSTS